jgi:hypothetical protein
MLEGKNSSYIVVFFKTLKVEMKFLVVCYIC